MILIFLFPYLGYCLSWASSLFLKQENYRNVSFMVPRIPDCGVLYAIRDLDATNRFQWTISHNLSQYNQTHDSLVFTIPKWPKELNSIVYDVVLSQKDQNFRVYHGNITQYQTHVPFKQQDYRNNYSLVLFPTGFSQSTLTMNFMWMPVRLNQIFVIHYMDHQRGTQTNNQNFGQNWVSFCVIYIKNEYKDKIINMQNMIEYQSIQKDNTIPYFAGIQKIHNSKAKISMRQTGNYLLYSSEHIQAVAIPLHFSHLLDTRFYSLQQQVSLFVKLSSLIFVLLVGGIIGYLITKNKTKFSQIWPSASGTEVSMNNDTTIKHRQLVQVD